MRTPRLPFCFLLLACTEGAPAVSETASDAAATEATDAGQPQQDAAVEEHPVEEISIAANGFTFDARAAGPTEGEPVFLLHGFPQSSRSFMAQLRLLGAAGYRAVAPDQRGYSKGARPSEVSAYAVINLLQDLLGMADALKFPRFHVVGHDWGASVAWAAAVIAKDRVQSLTALSVPHAAAFLQAYGDPSSCQARASEYIATFTAESAEAMFLANDAAFLRSLYVGLPPAEVAAHVAFFRDGAALTGGLNWYRATFRPGNVTPMLGPVTVPTLYVWSDGDISVCRQTAELTKDYAPGPYRFEVLDGLNHWLPELGGDRLNDLILEQLRAYPIPR